MEILVCSWRRLSKGDVSEERKCSYERYRILVQNESTAGGWSSRNSNNDNYECSMHTILVHMTPITKAKKNCK